MPARSELQKQLDDLRREYRAIRSMIEMMEKGTPRETILKMRKEKLAPMEQEMQRVEAELKDYGQG